MQSTNPSLGMFGKPFKKEPSFYNFIVAPFTASIKNIIYFNWPFVEVSFPPVFKLFLRSLLGFDFKFCKCFPWTNSSWINWSHSVVGRSSLRLYRVNVSSKFNGEFIRKLFHPIPSLIIDNNETTSFRFSVRCLSKMNRTWKLMKFEWKKLPNIFSRVSLWKASKCLNRLLGINHSLSPILHLLLHLCKFVP